MRIARIAVLSMCLLAGGGALAADEAAGGAPSAARGAAGDAALLARQAPRNDCAGFPRVALQTPAGYCVGRVADASHGLRFPRRMVEVAPGRYWLVDMGGWEPGRGRLLELTLPPNAAPDQRVSITVLADKLDRPHGLAKGPDGRIYIGEASRIWRTPVAAAVTPQTVIEGLPDDGAHPLKEIVFGTGGQLFINVGSASDACRGDDGKLPFPCPEVQGKQPRAAVYQAVLGGPDFTLQSLRPWAGGLRNSVALAFVNGPNVLLQAENSIDYPDTTEPAEELNVLREGQHYGWPYCVGARRAARGYERRFDCARTEAPAMLWPAHAAPLQMIVVPITPAAATATNNKADPLATASTAHRIGAWSGQLLVAWHGHRPAGHRVVSFALDAQGHAHGAPRSLISGWQAQPGVRPQGAPTGLLLDSAGRLFVLEDRNRTVLMLVPDAPKNANATARTQSP